MVSFRTKNQKLREFMAEFLGTMILVCIGCATNVATRLKQLDNQQGIDNTGSIVVPLGWGLALTVCLYLCGGVSGGHVNPAVTLGLASVGKINLSRLIHYMVAQYLGAFIGSLLTLIVYQESLLKFHSNETLGIFATEMRDNVSLGTVLMDQMIATALFLMGICAIIDERNMAVPKGLVPIIIGFVNIGVLHFSFGYNCGCPLNPARDLSPRILMAISELSDDGAFKNSYYWIPVLACHIGGIIGCWIYRLMIENHWPLIINDFSPTESVWDGENNQQQLPHHNHNHHQNYDGENEWTVTSVPSASYRRRLSQQIVVTQA